MIKSIITACSLLLTFPAFADQQEYTCMPKTTADTAVRLMFTQVSEIQQLRLKVKSLENKLRENGIDPEPEIIKLLRQLEQQKGTNR
jgi:hypothetical protein